MEFKGFGFSGYRSFSGELTKLAPLKKVNFVIGKNNAGKSNIIRFMSEQYEYFRSKLAGGNSPRMLDQNKLQSSFTDLDSPRNAETVTFRLAVPLSEDELNAHLYQLLDNKLPSTHTFYQHIKKVFDQEMYCDKTELYWFTYSSQSSSGEFSLTLDIESIKNISGTFNWSSVWSNLTNQSRGSLEQNWIPETIQYLAVKPMALPQVEVIPAIRKIGAAGTTATDHSGEGIIERLAKIQNPELTKQIDKEKFLAINKFLKVVLENDSAEIEIPHDRNMIIVHMDGKTLPLESLGTGIHEVIILAAASTLLEHAIVCIEEPELHLHPLLQKKLIQYLSDKTSNQYFFTTHSAHLLDATEAEIFHVTMEDGLSSVTAISSTKERSKICADLGYKASDVLQSNCVVWVEGPSDRTYLNFWIASKAPHLIEGVHYSIMFYGGRLSSHLSANDPDELKENEICLISLRKLNRNSAIVIDSDKDKARSRINDTKLRLNKEFNNGNGFAWITSGREIENYLDYDKVEEAVMAVHPLVAKGLVSKGKWENLLKYKRKLKGKTGQIKEPTANKVKVADYYVKNNKPDLSQDDLKKRVGQLVDFIKNSNGLTE